MRDPPHRDPEVIDVGVMPYADAYTKQLDYLDRVLKAREAGTPCCGFILLVEHPPVITISNRPSARQHLIATPEQLARAGVEVAPTDRGGDITYHGPGQLVVYPILDLNRLNLGLHEYMRLLETAIIEVCRSLGLSAVRDASATGVWIGLPLPERGDRGDGSPSSAAVSTEAAAPQSSSKICAMGVRVRKWVSMHGLALNVDPTMSHFDLIVPCGLAGRGVTSLRRELGDRTPSMHDCKRLVATTLSHAIAKAANQADQARIAARPSGSADGLHS